MNLNDKLNKFVLKEREEEKAVATINKYESNIKSFISFVDNRELNKEIILDFKDKLDTIDKFVPNTTNSYLISVNKFLKFIGRNDLCVKILKQQTKFSLKYSLTKSDYHRLCRFALKDKDKQNYIILKILAETGIRISELSYFTIENLDKVISIKNKGKYREITIKLDLLHLIRKYCRDNKIKKGPIIFNPKTKKEYADSTIWRRLKKLAGQARVNKNHVHAHAFRHYFAVCYLESYSNDIAGLADILGHSSLETTRIYTKMTNKEKELKLRKVKF